MSDTKKTTKAPVEPSQGSEGPDLQALLDDFDEVMKTQGVETEVTQISQPEPEVAQRDISLALDDDYKKYLDNLPKAKRVSIQNSARSMSTGMHSVAPMTCVGYAKCPFKKHCPIPERDFQGNVSPGPAELYPIGRSCVMEMLYLKQQVEDYMNYLQVDPKNPIEISIVNELALQDLYKNRATMVLAAGDKQGNGKDLMRKTMIPDPNGNGEREVLTEHPVLSIIERLEKRKQRMISKLMETREAKYQIDKTSVQETSHILSEIQRLNDFLASNEAKQLTMSADLDDDEIEFDD